jgi:hypothetical protein
MQHNIVERAAGLTATPWETEREVVAAISSAEGSANLRRGGARTVGIGLPLLSVAAGVVVGYGATRWLLPWLRRQPALATRPMLSSRRWKRILAAR